MAYKRRDPFYGSKEWKRVRRWVLMAAAARSRDGIARCEIEPGCQSPATCVDHIVPIRVDRSLATTPSNLRPGCAHHNAKRVMVDLVAENARMRAGLPPTDTTNRRDW